MKRVLLALLLVILVPPILILIALETGPGQRFAISQVNNLLSGEEGGIELGEMGGSLWDRLTLTQVRMSDAEGDWLTVTDITLDWSPFALLTSEAAVKLLEVGKVEMPRPPLPGAESPPTPSEDEGLIPALPSLPVDIDVEKLVVREVDLGAPLIGVPAQFGVAGDALWPRVGATTVTLDVEGQSQTELSVNADLSWAPDEQYLKLALAVEEPKGGLVSSLAGLPTLPSIDLSLNGEGPLSGWNGELRLALDGTEAVKGDLSLSGEPERRFSLKGRIDPSGSLPPDLWPAEARPWLAGGASLDVAAELSDELVTIERFELDAASFEIGLTGTLAPEKETVNAELNLAMAADSPLRDLVPEVTLGALTLRAEAEGALELPSLRVALAVDGVETPEATLAGLDLYLEGKPEEGQLQTTLDLRIKDPKVLVAEVPPLPYGSLRINAAALVDPEAGSARLDRFSLRGKGLTLTTDGTLELPAISGQPALYLEAVLPDLGQFDPMLAGLPLSLTLDSGLALDGLEKPIAANLDLTLVGTGGLPDGIGTALGGGLSLFGGVVYAPDGSITLQGVSLLGETLMIDLDGTVGEAEIALDWKVALADLAVASEVMGSPAAGSFDAEGSFSQNAAGALAVSATLDGKDLSAAGETIGTLTGDVSLAGTLPQISGEVAIQAPESGYGPLSLSAKIEPSGDEAFRIAPLAVALGNEVKITGDLTVPTAGVPVSGRLTGDLAGGKLLANLGVPLQGRGSLTVDLTARGEAQDAAVALTLSRGRIADIAHGGITLRANARDATGALSLDGRLDASDIAVEPAKLTSVAATFKGTPEAMNITLDTAGDVEGPARLALAGQVRQRGSETAIALSKLEGEAVGFPFSQTRQTEVTIGAAGPQSAKVGLTVAGAQVALDADLAGRSKTINLTLDDLDLAQLKPFLGEETPTGSIALQVALSGNRQAQGTVALQAKRLTILEDGLPVNPPIDINLDGNLGGDGLNLDGRLSGGFGQPLTMKALVPLTVSLAQPGANLSQTKPFSAEVDWTGEIGPLFDLAPIAEQRLTGQGTIDLAVTGTLKNPQASGQVTVMGGRYENLLTQTIIQDLTLVLEGSAQRLVIKEASGNDGQNGTLKLTGDINLASDPAPTLKFEVKVNDFALARRDDLYARMNVDMTVDGDLSKSIDVKGTITNEEIRASITPNLPPSVVALDVELVRDGKVINARPKVEEGEEEPAIPINLDITVDLPRRVFVAGLGLESEWGGKLFVRGTANKPFITGSIEPRRGYFAVFGKQFDLTDGSVAFDGSANINPTLDLTSVYDSSDITATIKITGSANAPKINLSSDPDMPEDEILSNVLFGRGTGQISPVEAIQLAEAAAILSGVTGSDRTTIDVIRQTIGVDVLRVESGDEDSDDAAVVTAGEYISEDVFVGVRQGTTPGSTQATVEVDLFSGLKFEGRAGADSEADNGAMLRWEWNY
ncbi:MAG: translocation/assembly module TamB domain-containing protein [Kiloniellales bacterium]